MTKAQHLDCSVLCARSRVGPEGFSEVVIFSRGCTGRHFHEWTSSAKAKGLGTQCETEEVEEKFERPPGQIQKVTVNKPEVVRRGNVKSENSSSDAQVAGEAVHKEGVAGEGR